MLFDTLAVTGGKPNASSVGNVISDPEPTTALMAPAATPAPRIPAASAGPIRSSQHDLDRKRAPRVTNPRTQGDLGELERGRRPARRPPLDHQRDAEAAGQVPLVEDVADRARG